jgi:cell wall-associated NlpC family hydrolase
MEISFGTRLPVIEAGVNRAKVALPGGTRLWVRSSAIAMSATGSPARGPYARGIVRTARQFLGLRYLWAGTSGFGFDCSGMVYSVYRLHGVDLPRDSGPQSTAGRAVARRDLRPGDLVFFGSRQRVRHVAIYVGAGRIIEAPSVGQGVREVDLQPDAAFAGARRVLP